VYFIFASIKCDCYKDIFKFFSIVLMFKTLDSTVSVYQTLTGTLRNLEIFTLSIQDSNKSSSAKKLLTTRYIDLTELN